MLQLANRPEGRGFSTLSGGHTVAKHVRRPSVTDHEKRWSVLPSDKTGRSARRKPHKFPLDQSPSSMLYLNDHSSEVPDAIHQGPLARSRPPSILGKGL